MISKTTKAQQSQHQLALDAYQIGDYEKASEIWEQYVMGDLNDSVTYLHALYYLAESHKALKREGFENDFFRFSYSQMCYLALDNCPEIWRARAHFELGKDKAALYSFLRAIERNEEFTIEDQWEFLLAAMHQNEYVLADEIGVKIKNQSPLLPKLDSTLKEISNWLNHSTTPSTFFKDTLHIYLCDYGCVSGGEFHLKVWCANAKYMYSLLDPTGTQEKGELTSNQYNELVEYESNLRHCSIAPDTKYKRNLMYVVNYREDSFYRNVKSYNANCPLPTFIDSSW